MEAGAELDRLVAETVMEQHRIEDCPLGMEGCPGRYEPHMAGFPCLPSYSQDIGAAWLVVGKLNFVGLRHWKASGIWEAAFLAPSVLEKYGMKPTIAKAETAPLAICRAALLAVTKSED